MTVSKTPGTVFRLKREKTLAMVHKRTKSTVGRRYPAVPTSNSDAPHATENCGAIAPRRRGVVQHLSASDFWRSPKMSSVSARTLGECPHFGQNVRILGRTSAFCANVRILRRTSAFCASVRILGQTFAFCIKLAHFVRNPDLASPHFCASIHICISGKHNFPLWSLW